MAHGKKYLTSAKKIDHTKSYTMAEAAALVKEMSYVKFDETVELAVKLTLKKSQSVRDTVVLPNQFAAQKRVLVFAKGAKADEAKAAGATYVGDDDLIQKIKEGWLDFDVAVATPDMMKDVGRLGPILGRKGLMPNPKTHTVTFEVAQAVKELSLGRTEFRTDKTNVVHLAVGKVSMDPAKVAENAKAVVDEIVRKKPSDAKGDYIVSVALSSSMGPGVKVANANLLNAAE